MIVTQTVEILPDQRLTIDIPPDAPAGKAQVEVRIIPFAKKEGPAAAPDMPAFRMTKRELDEMLKDCPITRRLAGILSDQGDTTIEQIRNERLMRRLR